MTLRETFGKLALALRDCFREQPQVHDAAVIHSTFPDEEPHYVTVCECGWVGEFYDNEADAFGDARHHTDNVQPEVLKRP